MPGPEQFPRLNIWAILSNLVRNFGIGVFTFAGVPVNGAAGTFANKAGLGSVLIDTTTGLQYINIGTLASPVWSSSGSPISSGVFSGGLGVVGNAKASYDFATDGGAISTVTPLNSPTLPIGAIILGGVLEVTTIPVGVGALIGVGLGAGAQVASLQAATAISGAPWSTIGMKAIIPVFTANTYVKVAAATKLTFTISGAPLTVGQFNVNVAYLLGN